MSAIAGGRAARIACIGGAALDLRFCGIGRLIDGTSNPVTGGQDFGGVARNVAENSARLGATVRLYALVGDDSAGRELREHACIAGIDTSGIGTTAGQTARYLAVVEPDGALKLGLADMAIFDSLTPDWLARVQLGLKAFDLVFAECNLPAATLTNLIASAPARLIIDGVSVAKCQRLPVDLTGVDTLFVNWDEASALCGQAGVGDALDLAHALVTRGAANAVVTMGSHGLAFAGARGEGRVVATLATTVNVTGNVTGAGDALIAGTLAAEMAGHSRAQALLLGSRLAAYTVTWPAAVRPDIGELFEREVTALGLSNLAGTN